MIRTSRQFFLLIGIVLVLLLSRNSLIAKGPPKELPMQVTVSDLRASPDLYDNHRVVVTGQVRSIEVQKGRRGGSFVLLVLEERPQGTPEIILSIQVVSLTLPHVSEGHRALVQGVYHREGWAGGRPFEQFIEAEAILREP